MLVFLSYCFKPALPFAYVCVHVLVCMRTRPVYCVEHVVHFQLFHVNFLSTDCDVIASSIVGKYARTQDMRMIRMDVRMYFASDVSFCQFLSLIVLLTAQHTKARI